MAVVYYYVPTIQLDEIVECGMKLSEYADRQMLLPGFQTSRAVLGTLLHPSDAPERCNDANFCCIKIEVDPKIALVGDAALYPLYQNHPHLLHLYEKHLIPLSQYRFGTFRKPECLLTTSVLSDSIEVVGRSQDIPMLYENSERLYLSNQLSRMEEWIPDAGDGLLCAWYEQQVVLGLLERVEDPATGVRIYLVPGKDGYGVFRMSAYKEGLLGEE